MRTERAIQEQHRNHVAQLATDISSRLPDVPVSKFEVLVPVFRSYNERQTLSNIRAYEIPLLGLVLATRSGSFAIHPNAAFQLGEILSTFDPAGRLAASLRTEILEVVLWQTGDWFYLQRLGSQVTRHDFLPRLEQILRLTAPIHLDQARLQDTSQVAWQDSSWATQLATAESRIAREPTAANYRAAAYCALHLQDFDKAYKYDTEAVSIDPSFVRSWVGLAVASALLGREESAVCALEKVEQLDGRQSENWVEGAFYLGRHYFTGRDFARAQPLLRGVADSPAPENVYAAGLRRSAKQMLAQIGGQTNS